MELLTITHRDFDLTIECSKFDAIWGKAKRNVGEENLTSKYTWTDGVESVVKYNDDGSEEEILQGVSAPAIFFDNADYPIWAEFKTNVTHAEFGSMLQSDNERFAFRKKRQILSGFINFGNDIGKGEIIISYVAKGVQRRFTFKFEVLSTKLNYHEHWRSIIDDIEAEYSMLSLDYMRRTFHGFSPDSKGERPDIVWWSIFDGKQQQFIKSIRSIIDRPRQRLRGEDVYLRADKIRRIPCHLENQLAEHKYEEGHLYRTEQYVHSNDTQENRFLKHALTEVCKKYEALKRRIEDIKNTSNIMREDMNVTLRNLKTLQRNPFFRSVGRFKGFSQESLVLQKATGYSEVYRTWNLLRRAYSLNDGLCRLQSKDIATLYEIWCFIEVSHIVKAQLGISDDDVEHNNRMEMNGVFTWDLGKGEHSRILFRKDGVELAELVYNPKHTDSENDSISIKNIVVPTVAQKPDIVLRLVKNDLQKGMKMTYLFDAKYRIDNNVNGVDSPPDDAINQMHRYRDAIYYKENADTELKKEIIGGYILFPGSGEPLNVQAASFYKSIDEVNIGAFPLRPKDAENRTLLESFIAELIGCTASDMLDEVIPQKGTFVDVGNRVLIGLVKKSNRKGYTKSFEDGEATLYYTGRQFPSTIALQDLHYFMPYMKEKGIRDVYEIVKVRSITSKEAKLDDPSYGDDLRLAFELRFSRKMFDDYKMVDTRGMINYTFFDTTFDRIKDILKHEDSSPNFP